MATFRMDIPDSDIPWESGLLFAGRKTGHNPYIYHVISEALLENPVKSIIELGTYCGGLTLYLGLWGMKMGVPVYTFDNQPNLTKDLLPTFEKMGVTYFDRDLLDPGTVEEVVELMGDEPTYLVIDGGDKPAELVLYARRVPVGSMVSIHDYGPEVSDEDLKKLREADTEHWAYIKRSQWQYHGVNTSTMVRIA